MSNMPNRIEGTMMKVYMAVFIGGVFGSVIRYGISLLMPNTHYIHFPWATFIVNISGAFILTYLLFHPVIQSKIDNIIMKGITTGLIGAYTTFSLINIEIVLLAYENLLLSIIYFVSTLLFGLSSSLLGYKMATRRVRL